MIFPLPTVPPLPLIPALGRGRSTGERRPSRIGMSLASSPPKQQQTAMRGVLPRLRYGLCPSVEGDELAHGRVASHVARSPNIFRSPVTQIDVDAGTLIGASLDCVKPGAAWDLTAGHKAGENGTSIAADAGAEIAFVQGPEPNIPASFFLEPTSDARDLQDRSGPPWGPRGGGVREERTLSSSFVN